MNGDTVLAFVWLAAAFIGGMVTTLKLVEGGYIFVAVLP